MRFKTKSLYNNPIIFYIIVLTFMKPNCLTEMELPLSMRYFIGIWDKLIILIALSILVLTIINRKFGDVLDVTVFFGYKVILTFCIGFFIHHILLTGELLTLVRRLTCILYIALALKYNFKLTTKRVAYIFAFLIVINFLTIIAFPQGLYILNGNKENFFLGYNNGHIVVIMPALFFVTEYVYYNKRRKMIAIVTWVTAVLSVMLGRSATSIVGIIMLLFLLMIIHFPNIRRFVFNWKTVILSIAFVFVFIIILRKQDVFIGLITKNLGRDVTFTNRIYLWDIAFNSIKNNLFFGIGDSSKLNTELFTFRVQKLAYAHNEILDILVRAGLIGLVIYIWIIKKSIQKMSKYKNSLHSKTWLAFLASYWIMMMFESYSNYEFYIFYFIMLLYPRFIIELDGDDNLAILNY